MPDRTQVDEWLRVHRMLMDKEAAFTDLAIRAAEGAISVTELDKEREALMDLRALCTSIYQKTFPKPH
ncbi:MAG: hypothetical protein K0R89_1558 [Ramlibacter sp.]|jgi:hypothetical protein|nr:hypothetical protein [Ramlibacter sp.]